MEIKLRPYQKKAATLAVSDVLKGHDPLVALPTGAGKTFTMAAIIKSLQAKGNDHFLVLTHVKEIIQQNQRAIEAALGENVSVYSAGLDKKQIQKLEAGDIIAVSGVENVKIGDTISSEDTPLPLPRIKVERKYVSEVLQSNRRTYKDRTNCNAI